MSRRTALITAAVLVVVAALAVFVAASTNPATIGGNVAVDSLDDLKVLRDGPQPSLAIGQGFANKRLTDASLKDKVVVYDFWTYSCVNCVRTLPYLRALHERYEKDGLVLVGVHSPEFEFEKNHDNVRAAVKRLQVTWPVVFDDDKDIWNAFRNQYWPAKYVADRTGDVRYVHFGEGEYEQTETVLRLLLGVDNDSPRAGIEDPSSANRSFSQTPETYLGTLRGGDAHVTLAGRWDESEEYVESTTAHETLDLRYQAGEVNLVIDRTRQNPTHVIVELDGKPIPERYRGDDVEVRNTETVVRVDEADMYRLIKNGPDGKHELRVRPAGAGVQLFAFTFGT